MSWFKVSDGLAFHRKALAAGNEALGAWVRAGAWSSATDNATDGYIPPEVSAALAPPKVWARLRAAGMTEAPAGGRPGEQLHDFLVYNPRGADAKQARGELSAKRSAAGARGAAKRWAADGNVDGKRDGKTMAEASQHDTQTDAPVPTRPDPSRPDQTPPPAEVREELSASQGDDLISVVNRFAADGNKFCVSLRDEVLATGGKLTHGQREAVKRIEKKRAEGAPVNALQKPAGPGEHAWTPGEEFRP